MSIGLVNPRTALFQPDQTQAAYIRNQSSGQINSPDSAEKVPEPVARSMIMNTHQASERAINYVHQVTASATQDEAFNNQLARAAQQHSNERLGQSIDITV